MCFSLLDCQLSCVWNSQDKKIVVHPRTLINDLLMQNEILDVNKREGRIFDRDLLIFGYIFRILNKQEGIRCGRVESTG